MVTNNLVNFRLTLKSGVIDLIQNQNNCFGIVGLKFNLLCWVIIQKKMLKNFFQILSNLSFLLK
jgi:hypothetical protein